MKIKSRNYLQIFVFIFTIFAGFLYSSFKFDTTLLYIYAVIISILFKRSFCGYICPVGFLSETLSIFSKNIKINKYVNYFLYTVKYVMLFIFICYILFATGIINIENYPALYSYFAGSNNDTSSNANTLMILTISIILIILLTLIIKNFWCRYLCPYGSFLGVISIISPFKIKRNISSCTSCKRCTVKCPQDINVHLKEKIISPDCIGCLKCIEYKSRKDCLEITNTKLSPETITKLTAVSFILFVMAVFMTN